MSEPDSAHQGSSVQRGGQDPYRRRLALGFSLFAVFFLFYVGAAVLQTPAFRGLASRPCLGMPLGLFLSLAIFPVSWALIVVFFAKSR